MLAIYLSTFGWYRSLRFIIRIPWKIQTPAYWTFFFGHETFLPSLGFESVPVA